MSSDQPSNSSRHQSAPAKLTGVVLTDKELGRGSDAVVQEAYYQGTVCAAKQLHEILLKDQLPGGAQRFRDNFDEEISKWCELKHPHIVLLLGVYYEVKSPVPILILEKMQTNLRRYIETHKKEAVPIPDKIFILRQVSQALAYLHGRQQPLVHHDLSPNNILLNQGSLLTKITDFGMSRIVDSSHSTRKSSMKGTLAFMSPEALSIPLKYTEKLDIFSFGNVVLFALTHVWPELGPSVVYEGNKAVAVEEFERREQYTKSLTTKEQSLFFPMIQSCLQNRPDRRLTSFQLVREMREMEGAHPRLDCSNTIAQLIEQLKKKDSQLEEKDDHLKVKDLHIQKLTKRVEELSEEVEAQKQREIGLKRDMDKLFAEKIAELESENLTVRLQEQNRLLQTQLNAASMEYQGLKQSTGRTISSLKEQLHAAYMEHDDLKKNIEHMKASRDRWRSEEVDQLKKNLEEAQKTIRSLEDQLEDATAWYSGEHARVKELIKEMKRREMAQNSSKHLEEQIQKLTKRVEELLEEVEARKQHENGLKRDMDRLFTEKTELESENLTARLQMEIFKNDFEEERKDREGAHGKFADQEKEWMENIQRSADEKDNLIATTMQLKEEIIDLKHKISSGTSALSQEYHQSFSTSEGQGNSPHRFRDQGKYGTTDYDFELTNPKLNRADYDINMHQPIPMPGGEPNKLPNQPWPRGEQQPRPHGDQQPRPPAADLDEGNERLIEDPTMLSGDIEVRDSPPSSSERKASGSSQQANALSTVPAQRKQQQHQWNKQAGSSDSCSGSDDSFLPSPMTKVFQPNQQYIGNYINREILKEAKDYSKHAERAPEGIDEGAWPYDPNLQCKHCGKKFRQGQIREFRYHIDDQHAPSMMS